MLVLKRDARENPKQSPRAVTILRRGTEEIRVYVLHAQNNSARIGFDADGWNIVRGEIDGTEQPT